VTGWDGSELTDLPSPKRLNFKECIVHFQVKVNAHCSETNTNPNSSLRRGAQENEPITGGFAHLQVEARFGLDRQTEENKVAKKKELKKAKKIQATKTLCCSGTH
jgi:hypothetical protein